MSIDGKHRMMDVKITHLRIYLSPRRKAITGVMRNGTLKESKGVHSLWRQAPDIKRTLKAGGLRVISGASLLSPMRPK
jgi:hypothetical protein